MFTSITIRAALTALSTLALALSAGATTAQAATATSTTHYQKQIFLTDCTGNSCTGSFPKVPAGHQLNLTRMSCYVKGSSGSTFTQGDILLSSANNVTLLNVYLPGNFSSSDGYHTLNQAVDVQATAAHYIVIYMVLATGTATSGACTATGTLNKLN